MHRPKPVVLALLLMAPVLVGCHKVQARVELKKGNAMYMNESYRGALVQYQKGLELDPDATFAWRSVGLSALALYHPGDESPQNRQYGDLAIQAFQKYLADYPDDQKVYDYMMATLVNAKRFDDALAYLAKEAQAKPNDPNIQATRVRILIQAGKLQEAWQLAQQVPTASKAEALYSIGVSAWDKSYHDANIDHDTRAGIVDMGLKAMDEALKVKPDYFEAMTYYNLLYREKAKLETDANLRLQDTALADEWLKKAMEQRKKSMAKPAATPTPSTAS
jgi:tetratricopeptide (TPR) repeat protein